MYLILREMRRQIYSTNYTRIT